MPEVRAGREVGLIGAGPGPARTASRGWRVAASGGKLGPMQGEVHPRLGGCLCGAVRYELKGKLTSVTFCHCSMCRRWHGHVGAYTAVDRSGFVLLEERGLRWHASSAKVRRGFCSECGSSLLFEQSDLPKIAVCAGSLDEPTGLVSRAHIFVASKGDYYELAEDGLRRIDGSP